MVFRASQSRRHLPWVEKEGGERARGLPLTARRRTENVLQVYRSVGRRDSRPGTTLRTGGV